MKGLMLIKNLVKINLVKKLVIVGLSCMVVFSTVTPAVYAKSSNNSGNRLVVYYASRGIILANNVNVRSEPNLQSSIIKKLQKNDWVSVPLFYKGGLPTTRDWTLVELDNGKVGYIYSKYVEVDT